MPSNKYRLSNDKMAISLSAMSDKIPCHIRKFRSSFNALQNCRWKNDDLASCSCFGKIGMNTSFSRAAFILSSMVKNNVLVYLDVGRIDG